MRGEGLEVEDRGLRVEVQQMLDTWDIEAQRRRTGARALVTVFSDARAARKRDGRRVCRQQDPWELRGGAGRGNRARAVCARVFGRW